MFEELSSGMLENESTVVHTIISNEGIFYTKM